MLRIGVRTRIRRLIDQAVLVALGIGEHRRIFFADTLFAKVVEAKISDDAVDPGVERALKAKAAQVLVGLQKGVLVNVLCVGFGTGEAEREPQNTLVVVADEFFERGAIATLRLSDQSVVVHATKSLGEGFSRYCRVSCATARGHPNTQYGFGRHLGFLYISFCCKGIDVTIKVS